MRRRAFLVGLVGAAIVLAAVGAVILSSRAAAAGPLPVPQSYDQLAVASKRLVAVPGQIIVKFKDEASSSQRAAAVQAQGGTLATRLGVPGYYLVTVKEVELDTVPKTITALSHDPAVASAQPNYYRYADMTPNDPYFASQWNMQQIGMPAAWDVSAGEGVTVAVIDTGVAYEDFGQFKRAPDLATTTFVSGWNFVNNTAHANDDNAHGTHVAGTIAQATNNALGAAGVAYKARIMPLKALDASGVGQDDWVASAIVWAADNGAKVINLSLGAESPSPILEDAVNAAYAQGVTVIAAAGNSGTGTINYPAACAKSIAVGAVRWDGTRAVYSNYGTGLTLVAPGGDLTVDQDGDGYPDGILQQTFDPNTRDPSAFGLWFFQGTSMATPHVSGVAALLLSRGVVTTPVQLIQALQETAKDLDQPGWDPQYGSGLVQARAALEWGAKPPATTTATATATPTPAGTATATPSVTRTATRTATQTAVATASSTPTRTRTATPSRTGTASRTPTRTRTATPSPTGTATRTPTRTRTATPASPLTITGVRILPANLPSGELLQIEVGVRNDGASTALTQGPTPGFVYSQGDTADRLGYPDIAGRWRVGVDLASRTTGKDHPYRWGLGGNLAPGASVTVTGYIRLTTQRTTNYWVGLVQERVRWWQDRRDPTGVTVGPALGVYRLRLSGGTATRYAFVYQCTTDGQSQRVWRVDSGRSTATYLYARPLPSGASCGVADSTHGQYPLTISGGTITANVLVMQCVGSGAMRNVWRAASDGRSAPFASFESASSCP